MGMAMALNLIKAGFELTGFDLRQERLDMLKEAGGKPASSPAEGGSRCRCRLHHGDDRRAGRGRCLWGGRPSHDNGTGVYHSAYGDDQTRGSADAHRSRGEGWRAPDRFNRSVAERVGADSGTLTLMASAPQEVFEANQGLDASGRPEALPRR